MIAGLVAFNAVRADAVGDDETTFVPITACRLIDTRPDPDRVGPFGTFGDNETNTIVAHGANGKCTIPTTATGLSLNVTALHATEVTYLTFWDDGDRPKASSLNPAPGQPPTPNAVNVPLSDTGTFQVYNAFGSVNIIIDIAGYYTRTSLDALEAAVASMPLTSSAFNDEMLHFGPEATELIATSLTAPADGTVVVIANVYLSHMGGADVTAHCSITTGAAVEDEHSVYQSSNPYGPLTLVRAYDVVAGNAAVYRLVCDHWPTDQGSPFVSNRTIAATFTLDR